MKNKAFTLVETLMAITLMTVVITAVTGLILSTLMANSRNQHDLQATLLAREGLEALRYMRDSNWLQNYQWDGGDELWGGNFIAGSDPEAQTVYLKDVGNCTATAPCFQLSSIPEDGEVTLGEMVFTRRLDLVAVGSSEDPPDPNTEETEVTAVVTWDEHGIERSVELSTYLTNWK